MDENKTNSNETCMVCGRSEQQAGKLMHLPGPITICPDCMQNMADAMNSPQMQDMMNMFGISPDMMGTVMPGNRQTGAAEEKTAVPSEKSEERPEEETKSGSEGDNNGTNGNGGNSGRFGGLGNIFGIPLGNIFGYQNGPQVTQTDDDPGKIKSIRDIPAPHKIKEALDEYVVGQEQAKKVISVAVYNHYKRVFSDATDAVEIEKSNILMIGPTGCGKTYLVRTLARVLDVPLAVTDATSLTEAGYIGDDIESVISKLLSAAGNNVERCQRGIVFIDEIDKIAKKKNTSQRDVSGEAVQQGLLRLLEGAEVEVPVGATNKNAMVPMATINTKNILFICGGAFPGLNDIIRERLSAHASIGFRASLSDEFDDEPNLQMKATAEDVRKFGMIPEFIGRLPILCTLEDMSDEMMIRILKEPKNAIIRQYQKLLELDEVDLQFDDDALEAIAQLAKEKKTGARALRSVIEEFMLDIMYEIPKDDNIGTVRITRAYIERRGGPVVTMRGVPLLKG